MSKRNFLPLLVIALPLFMVGCATSPMQIDASLAARAEAMRVRRSSFLWREALAFGPFQVKLSSGIPWETVSGDFAAAGLASQSHRFEITDGSGRIHATCRTRSRAGWAIGNLPRPPVVQCSLRSDAEHEAWTIFVEQAGLRRLKGTLDRENGPGEIKIASMHRREDAARDLERPIGYTLIREGVVVAVVDGNGGRVWIDPEIEERDRLRAAATAAALILFNPADEE